MGAFDCGEGIVSEVLDHSSAKGTVDATVMCRSVVMMWHPHVLACDCENDVIYAILDLSWKDGPISPKHHLK
jgi:hypothetical protein